PATDVYEAELASLTGVAIANNAGASGGQYVNMEGQGTITWAVTVPSAGTYDLDFGYLIPYGNKTQHLDVNGTRVGDVTFSGTANQWLELTYTVALNAGQNTVTLTKSWGYMHFDYLKVQATPAARALPTAGTDASEAGLPPFLVAVYPNPATEVLNLRLQGTEAEAFTVVLYTLQGQTVLREQMVSQGSEPATLRLPNDLPEGFYYYQILSGSRSATGKVYIE
ncbi:MAG TPA: hypothetical protein DCP28_07060, partial [Cytophagales bacterium]|nr:hypothetical protein [Cytophagales bacterium]